jgi:D-serine deaminase-like pyridoxal phosphate-dependent protein
MNIEGALEIDAETPFMVIDEDQTRSNIKNMQNIASSNNKKLRPHSKTHKIPEIASWQIADGASGVCVQKVSEAEVMFNGGIKDILISNEVVDRRKTDKIAELAREGCNILVAIDSMYGAMRLSESALYKHVKIGVIVDIDIGMHRCGVSIPDIRTFNNSIKNMNGINIEGFMAYDGQVHATSEGDREKDVESESIKLKAALDSIENETSHGILSVGGTPTSAIWAKYDFVNELQPGTYVYYDMHCNAMNLCSVSDISMGVVSQVMSSGN